MKYCFIFFSSLLFLIGCLSTDDKNDIHLEQKVTITGQIDSVSSQVVSISYGDLFRQQNRYTEILDSTGSFHFSFNFYHGQDILLTYDEKSLKLFVEPSDSLHITFSARDFQENSNNTFPSVQFSGSNKTINRELIQYGIFHKAPPFQPQFNKPVTEYLADLKSQVELENAELDHFIDYYQPSDKFIQWAVNNILYSNANYLVHYKAFLNYSGLPRNDSLLDVSLFPVHNEESLVSSMFLAHLWNYGTDRYFQSDSLTLKYLIDEEYLKAYSRCMDDILMNEPAGIIRDILIFKLLSPLINDSFDDLITIWNGNKNLISSQILINELEDRIILKENNKDYGTALLTDLSEGENKFIGDVYKKILQDSKDKLIYLDIWATWCGPCLSQIPDLISLHNEVASEKAEIISVCLKSDKSRWNKIVNENKIPGKHFFLDNEASQLLMSNLKIKGFPTYMIIKDGMIVNHDAPWPSSSDDLMRELKINEL